MAFPRSPWGGNSSREAHSGRKVFSWHQKPLSCKQACIVSGPLPAPVMLIQHQGQKLGRSCVTWDLEERQSQGARGSARQWAYRALCLLPI